MASQAPMRDLPSRSQRTGDVEAAGRSSGAIVPRSLNDWTEMPLPPNRCGDPLRELLGKSWKQGLDLDGSTGQLELDRRVAKKVIERRLQNAKKTEEEEKAPAEWQPWRHRLLALVRHRAFDAVSVVLIVLNVLLMGFQIDQPHDFWLDLHDLPVLGLLFLVAFLSEFGLRLACRISPAQDMWLLLDGVSCACGTAEEIINLLSGGNDPNNYSSVMLIVGVFRLFRLLRLARGLRKIRTVHLLVMTLTHHRSNGWQSVVSITIFISIYFLTFAMYFRWWFGTREGPFRSVAKGFISFVEAAVGSATWLEKSVEPLLDDDSLDVQLQGLLLLFALLFSVFYLRNLCLSIWLRQVVDLGRVENQEKEYDKALTFLMAQEKLGKLTGLLGRVEDKLSWEALEECMSHHPEAFHQLNLDREKLWSIFNDTTRKAKGQGPTAAKSNSTVDFQTFSMGMMKEFGAPVSGDMLIFRMQMFEREIDDFERKSQEKWPLIEESIHTMRDEAKQVDARLDCLQRTAESISRKLDEELRERDAMLKLEGKRREQELQLRKVRRKREREWAHQDLKSRVEEMEERAIRLRTRRQMAAVCSGSQEKQAALRRAVRTDLDRRLAPWLKARLSGQWAEPTTS